MVNRKASDVAVVIKKVFDYLSVRSIGYSHRYAISDRKRPRRPDPLGEIDIDQHWPMPFLRSPNIVFPHLEIP